MFSLKSTILLAGMSSLCLAAPACSAPVASTTSTSAATVPTGVAGSFPIQIKSTGGKFLYTLKVGNGTSIVNTDTLFAVPDAQGNFQDSNGSYLTSDGKDHLPFSFQVFTPSLNATGSTAATCYVAGNLPAQVPSTPLTFTISDNGLNYLSPCGPSVGWNTVRIICEGPVASCTAA